ncbi:MAG: polysaccharide pyruvyl transferase family protein [Rhodocyclaceae bacterium]
MAGKQKIGAGETAPVLLVGAHDRHNFGDLLFAHIAASFLPAREIVVAGLIARDLTAHGGFAVAPLAGLAQRFREAPVEIVHVGGEILTTTAWQAAVMLAEPDEVPALIARFDADPVAAHAYAAQRFGIEAEAPYVVGRERFPSARRIVFDAVGGAELDRADPALKDEVFAKLRQADSLFVRDRTTQAALAAAGIAANLVPDPVALIAECFGARIGQRKTTGEVVRMRAMFPEGFVAVQFAAECGDDATLALLARQLDRIAAKTGCGAVFFRAGSAPWHDDLEVYRHCAARLAKARWQIFTSLDIWQIAALIAQSRGFIGTSLHGHVVASAFALPRVSFLPPSQAGRPNKIGAYLATWEMAEMPGIAALDDLAEAFFAAQAVDLDLRCAHAQRLAWRRRLATEEILTA